MFFKIGSKSSAYLLIPKTCIFQHRLWLLHKILLGYLKMIFEDIPEQTVIHLQFKFELLSRNRLNSFNWRKLATKLGNTRYVEIGHPIYSTLCENYRGAILDHIFCTCFTNTPIFSPTKWKIIFLWNKAGNYFWQYCLSRKDSQMCQVWALYHKLCHENSHNFRHLAWKAWMFIHDKSFCERMFLKICQNWSLSFFLPTSTYKRTPCQRIAFFEIFFIFLDVFQNRVKIACTSLHSKDHDLSTPCVDIT